MPLDLIFVAPGNYTIEDNGIPGDNISVIKDGTGTVIFTFAHPADSLSFTVAVPGVNLTFNFTDSLGAADFRVGDLTNPGATPDSITIANVQTTGTVTLVSNGAISEFGSDAAADIVAGELIMSAGTGVGSAGNAIETQTSAFEGESTTGGIAITNFGAVTIGGLTADVNGLEAGTSGDIVFTATGTITLSDTTGVQSVRGGTTSGDVTLTALGFDSDIVANVNRDSIATPGGSIFLNAGRDILFGAVGADFDNDVRARGSITVLAGRDFVIDGFSDMSADDFGQNTGGNVTITTGRNIGILNNAGTDASVGASGNGGGDVILTTGAGGALIVNANSSAALFSTSGDVIITADRLLVGGTSGITANNGDVLIQARTGGWGVVLGSGTDAAAAIELSSTELGRIFTSNLVIGAADGGPLTVVAPVTFPNAPNVTLVSGTNILIQANTTVLNALTLLAGDNIFVTPSTINVPTFTAYADQAGNDLNTGGIINVNALVASTTALLQGNADADTITGTSADETINGLEGNDTLKGNGGIDLLNGGAGADNMDGGLGNDTFLVDSAEDRVLEAVGEGTDIVYSDVSFVLGAGSEVEILSTSNQAGAAALALVGNEFGQQIYGNAGDNFLEGGGGTDFLIGFAGNDTYVVDGNEDVVVDGAGEGTDIVYARASYTLGAGAEIEVLSAASQADVAAVSLIGNSLNQSIFGNAGANFIEGGGGADILVGLAGDDTYLVDSTEDYVGESVGGGRDVVYATASYTLGAGQEVEILSTTSQAGAGAIDLTGNEFANEIYGNAGANTLNGGGGADYLQGFGGADNYYVDDAADSVIEAAGGGNDSVYASVSYALAAGQEVEFLLAAEPAATTALNLTGNEFANTIYGNDGANVLDGKDGSDLLVGQAGADTFAFTTALGAGNIDVLLGVDHNVDKIALDDAIFTAIGGPGALNANAFVVGSAAADADDRIIYNSTTGQLFYDADGTGAGAAIQFATLSPGLGLTASDFQVI